MSIRKWQDIAKQKEVVENQRKNILNAFKERKVKDEMGGLAAEKLFRPLTRRMGEKQIQFVAPDYDVDDEIRNWDELPFEGDEDEEEDPDYSLLKEDIPDSDEVFPGKKQPPSSTPPPPSSTPPPDYPKFPRDPDSTTLGILNRFINSNRHNPKATISTPQSKFHNWTIERAKAKVEEIYEKRRNSVRDSRENRIPFHRFAGLSHRERREYIGMKGKRIADIKQLPQFKNMEENQLKETFGTGFISNWINRLSLGISSIKLKKEVQRKSHLPGTKKENFIFKMSLSILLDSQIAKQQNPNQKSHDFTIRFDPPIVLNKNKNYKAALNEVVTMSYSWYNVRAVYGNNTLKWKKKSDSSWKTITLPDGMFTYDDINSFMQKKLGKVDPPDKDSDELFTLFFDSTIYRAVILLDNSIELGLSSGSFADLLGFEKKVLDQKTNISKFIPNITKGVDWVFIHCDLITREVKNVGSDVLISLPTSTRQISDSFSKEPKRLQWHTVNKNTIQSIRVYVKDGRNGIWDINYLDLAISLFIKEEDKIHD